MTPQRRYQLLLVLSIVVIIPLGYAIRFTPIPGGPWLNDFLGSVAYEIFWIALAALIWPTVSLRTIALSVCLATCAIEFLQLWQPPFLQALRATLPGRLVLGNTFLWSDFPAYVIGSVVGWLWVKGAQ